MTRYPPVRHVLFLSLLVLPLSQFLVYPALAPFSPHLALVAAEFVLLWALSLSVRRRRWSLEDVLLLNATSPRVLTVAAVTAAGAAVLIAQLDLAWAELLWLVEVYVPVSLQRNLLEIQLVDDLPGLAGVATGIVIAPGVCEEAFFRGFVLTSLAAHRSIRVGVVGSALLFAALHLNPWQLPALVLFGLFLGLLVHWTHSIYPAIVAHMTNNLLSVMGVNVRAYTGVDWL
ncbi:type II CAAX prenyl endopeptidase Rce1 family protein, partial [Candidatus Latescibacterota bacterium]